MTAAVRALTWEILARYRRTVVLGGLYLVALCLAAPLVPEGTARLAVPFFIAPLAVGVACLLMALTHGDQTRIEAAAGGFPPRLLLLPVSAGVLAGVPLVLSMALLPALWTAVAVWVLRPSGIPAPLFWPGVLAGVSVAWLLALSWLPMPFPWVRLGVLGAVVGGLVVGTMTLFDEAVVSSGALLLGLAALWPPAFGLAVVGVRACRSGGAGEATGSGEVAPAAASGAAVPPFRSPLRALLWLEWCLHGRALLYLSLFCLAFLLPVVVLSDRLLHTRPYLFEAFARGPQVQLGPAWAAVSWLFLVPVIYTMAGGGEAGLFARGTVSAGVPVFVAVRPVANGEILKSIFLGAALHLGLMGGVMVAAAVAWAVVSGNVVEMAEGLTLACGSPAAAALVLLGALAAGYAVVYLLYVGWMWVGLFGLQIAVVVPAAVNVSLAMAAAFVVHNWRPGWVPWVQAELWVALGLKAVAVIALAWLNTTRGLARPSTTVLALLAWGAAAAALAGGAAWLTGEPTAALAVVVFLPLARLLAAPAALHRGRHGGWA